MFFREEYDFLSNFYPAPFRTPSGRLCPTVEHAFQACKTENKEEQEWILSTNTPGQAKARGRQVSLREGWEDMKLQIMYKLVLLKFQQNPELAQKLVKIKEDIVEHNTWGDKYWGVHNGKGANHLGKILMRVRSELQKEFLGY